ncbi:glycosyltransferase [Zobellia sp. B3R18]|uniref:glycosyltransferase n=1 Tax=Zobellia sp. B3R18 TaxID=2841568 RepID=UPI001C06FB95|nr:glycosyltransferase [Zobellia sp. B3R18]MBU2975922.1 glycosyltransferase [Zobellia sp. B3R18]
MESLKKVKVVFIIPSLKPGGAERVFAFVSQNLDQKRFRSELLVIGHKKDSSYIIENIPVTYLYKERVLYAIPSIINFIKLNKPNIVLTSIGHLNLIAGGLTRIFKNTQFIIRPTNIQTDTKITWWESKCISWVDSIICQSQDMSQNFRQIYRTPSYKISIIQNPITNVAPIIVSDTITKLQNFVTVGRLNKVKGHIRIIELLSELEKDFHYTIIGDGPEREKIFSKIEFYGLKEKITHIPFTNEVNKYLLKNDLFLQGSYSEGFPNAALESCTMGTPVLAFDVPGGTKEIIQNGVNGYLVDSKKEFLNALNGQSNWSRNKIRKSVLENFGSKVILKKYEELLLSFN